MVVPSWTGPRLSLATGILSAVRERTRPEHHWILNRFPRAPHSFAPGSRTKEDRSAEGRRYLHSSRAKEAMCRCGVVATGIGCRGSGGGGAWQTADWFPADHCTGLSADPGRLVTVIKPVRKTGRPCFAGRQNSTQSLRRTDVFRWVSMFLIKHDTMSAKQWHQLAAYTEWRT